MKINSRAPAFALLGIIFSILSAQPTHAYTQMNQASASAKLISNKYSTAAIARFENDLTPFLVNRTAGTQSTARTYAPTQEDLFTLARSWSQLSPNFKTLYASATKSQANQVSIISASGHFQIFYSTTGADSVDNIDLFQYNSDPTRMKTFIPNGIPDYVDEVAWAFDSVWQKEIEISGFIATESPYPVHIINLDISYSGYYGITWPTMETLPMGIGFKSFIQIRNQWHGNNWNNPPYINYQLHPEHGVRVTAAHEFFHGIQFAMTSRLQGMDQLNDYPVSWLEGTAVLMEEICFDSINDYVQYVESFYKNPSKGLLAATGFGNYVYENGLLMKYLYQFSHSSPNLSIIKNVFFKEYQQPSISFTNALTQTAELAGWSWPELLNRFHTSVLFSGSNYNPRYTFSDAQLFPAFVPLQNIPDSTLNIRKITEPWGCSYIHLNTAQTSNDTLRVTIDAWNNESAPSRDNWGLSYVFFNANVPDSVVPILSALPESLIIPTSSRWSSVCIVATNGSYTESRNIGCSLSSTYLTPTIRPMHVYPNPVRKGSTVTFAGQNIFKIALFSLIGQPIFSSERPSELPASSLWKILQNGQWECRFATARSGRSMAPGIYIARISSISQGKIETTIRKIEIIPAQ